MSTKLLLFEIQSLNCCVCHNFVVIVGEQTFESVNMTEKKIEKEKEYPSERKTENDKNRRKKKRKFLPEMPSYVHQDSQSPSTGMALFIRITELRMDIVQFGHFMIVLTKEEKLHKIMKIRRKGEKEKENWLNLKR